MHEMGHLLDYGHSSTGSVMDSSLPPGRRRLANNVDSDRDDDTLEMALVDDFFATLDG